MTLPDFEKDAFIALLNQTGIYLFEQLRQYDPYTLRQHLQDKNQETGLVKQLPDTAYFARLIDLSEQDLEGDITLYDLPGDDDTPGWGHPDDDTPGWGPRGDLPGDDDTPGW